MQYSNLKSTLSKHSLSQDIEGLSSRESKKLATEYIVHSNYTDYFIKEIIIHSGSLIKRLLSITDYHNQYVATILDQVLIKGLYTQCTTVAYFSNPIKNLFYNGNSLYDGFLYNGEEHILNLRIGLTYSQINHFIITESQHTFTGTEKDTTFYIQNYIQYKHLIIYLLINDTPYHDVSNHKISGLQWRNETFQRNSICTCIKLIRKHDHVIVSDVDEIANINSNSILSYTNSQLYSLKSTYWFFHFFIDTVLGGYHDNQFRNMPWIMLPFMNFRNYNECMINYHIRIDWNCHKNFSGSTNINGWHFSYMIPKQQIVTKLLAYSHVEIREILKEEGLLHQDKIWNQICSLKPAIVWPWATDIIYHKANLLDLNIYSQNLLNYILKHTTITESYLFKNACGIQNNSYKIEDLLYQNNVIYMSLYNEQLSRFKRFYNLSPNNSARKIPLNIHYIILSENQRLNRQVLEPILSNNLILNTQNEKWIQYIWTNSTKILKNTPLYNISTLPIQILDELHDYKLAIQYLINNKFYDRVIDIIKHNIITHKGGICSTLTHHLISSPEKLHNIYYGYFSLETLNQGTLITNSFTSMHSHHIVNILYSNITKTLYGIDTEYHDVMRIKLIHYNKIESILNVSIHWCIQNHQDKTLVSDNHIFLNLTKDNPYYDLIEIDEENSAIFSISHNNITQYIDESYL